MLIIIAWRNIWRHKVRSLVVMLSIAVGLWAGVFMIAFSWGMYKQYMIETIETRLSHLQIHHPQFREDLDVQFMIQDHISILEYVNSMEEVKATTSRTITTGMVSSPTTASGVAISGIFPEEEKKITKPETRIIEGNYLDTSGRNPILIGQKLAQKLKVKVKSKIILTFQDSNGEIVAGAFRVAGIYRSKNSTLDELNVYVRGTDLNQILNIGNSTYEIAILLDDDNKIEEVKQKLHSKFPHVEIMTWKELSPEISLVINSFNEFMYIFIGIILLALTFGIVNTMLMAVLERVREIGMLMAIGMNRRRIFFMVVIETIFLALIGGPVGLMMGFFTIKWTGEAGINLSMFSEGLSSWGYSNIVYPELEPGYYLPLTLMTILTAILSSLYPAVRALRMKPSEAIRKI